ncbi:MAG: methyltransferase, partial [Myxococcota bacterium]
LRAMARKVMSDYDANGVAGTHDMRVLGAAQWRELLAQAGVTSPPRRLLDVGAGEGNVTATLTELLGPEREPGDVVTTELSGPMARRLRKRGWRCHEVDLATAELPGDEAPFDLVGLLNVIDRTSRPLTLLERLRPLTRGVLLLAVPLPVRPHVHMGPVTMAPEERLPSPLGGRESFEAGASALAELAFRPTGWHVAAFARAPYLCRGGASQPVIALDDAVFVLRPAPPKLTV